ncbi:MAG: 50S ribosomal protein L9 [Pseudomonadota bacterium]
MEVILQENVRSLGNLGEQVRVKPGYARNYLLPKGIAVRATPENIEAFEARRAELEKKAAEVREAAEKRAAAIAGVGAVTLKRKATEEGKLFGAIAASDVAEALNEGGAEVERKEITFPDGVVREVGEFPVEVYLHTEISQPVTLVVEAE